MSTGERLVRDALAEILVAAEVGAIFGQTGGHVMGLWESAYRAGLRTIFNRHEASAVMMADGYRRASGNRVVVFAAAGPAATNLATGLGTAYSDSIPLVAIAIGVQPELEGRHTLQDGSGRGASPNQYEIARNACKAAIRVGVAQAATEALREAFQIAENGRPGPVYLELPWPMLDQKISPSPAAPIRLQHPACDETDLRRVTDVLRSASSPVILIGEGATELEPRELMGYLEQLGAPFAVSPLAKSLVDERHPLCIGALQEFHRRVSPVRAFIASRDVVLLLGCRLKSKQLDARTNVLPSLGDARVIQIDPDPNEIGRVVRPHLAACGAPRSFLRYALTSGLSWSSRAEGWLALAQREPIRREAERLTPLAIVDAIESIADDDANVVVDVGYTKAVFAHHYRTTLQQRFLTAEQFGTMGYSIPAAIGARIGNGKETICVVGDGSFYMTFAELTTATARSPEHKVIVIVLDNGGHASMRDAHRTVYGESFKQDSFHNLDFVLFAEAIGACGYSAETPDELRAALMKAKAESSTCLIRAIIREERYPAGAAAGDFSS